MRYLINLFLITLAVARFASAAPVVSSTEQDNISNVIQLVGRDVNTAGSVVGTNDGTRPQNEHAYSSSSVSASASASASAPLTSAAAILIEQILKSDNQADINLIGESINMIVLYHGYDYNYSPSSVGAAGAASAASSAASSAGSSLTSSSSTPFQVPDSPSSAITYATTLARSLVYLVRQLTKSNDKVTIDFIGQLIQGVVLRKDGLTTSSSDFSTTTSSRPTRAFIEEILRSSSQLDIKGVGQRLYNFVLRYAKSYGYFGSASSSKSSSEASAPSSASAISSVADNWLELNRAVFTVIEQIFKSTEYPSADTIFQFIRDAMPTISDQASNSSVP